MNSTETMPVTVKTLIQLPVAKIWFLWTKPEHIVKWNFASEDWHTPFATNDLKVNGTFTFRMESKDGKAGFDLCGRYSKIIENELLEYSLEDGRFVKVEFSETDGYTRITEVFDPEDQNSRELQQAGWQAILDNFKKYAEQSG